MALSHIELAKLELGKKSQYPNQYDASRLLALPRQPNRDHIGIADGPLPFYGYDIWNHYEVSWLNTRGKPVVALAEIIYDCASLNLIESKTMKLYFNSLNQTQFQDVATVQALIKTDLAERLQTRFVDVRIQPLHGLSDTVVCRGFPGTCIDELDVTCTAYDTDISLLTTENEVVEETLCSDLLKSNCLVTGQPDWCSVQISYHGKKINHQGLLCYLVSFRNANEFHEHCVEKIFTHLMQCCGPQALTVHGRSTRRGGIDINSYRSTKPLGPWPYAISNLRLCRQ